MILYRAISTSEYKDFKADEIFRTAQNTLEAKQFFRSEKAVLEFIRDAEKQAYKPPYKYLLTVHIDNQCFENLNYTEQELDRFAAITIHEDDLTSFNNCVTFTGIRNV